MLPQNKYSFCQKVQLIWWLIRTKLLCRKARLIRFPFDLRGGEIIDLGRSLTTGVGCRIEAFPTDDNAKKIFFGNHVQLNDYVHISAMNKVIIGDFVLIASHVYISDNSHGSYKGDENDTSPDIPPIKRTYFTSPVTIGANTWIGESVMILPGAIIGNGCVIGAHSIVREGIYPAYSMLVGTPARIVKRYNKQTRHWEK